MGSVPRTEQKKETPYGSVDLINISGMPCVQSLLQVRPQLLHRVKIRTLTWLFEYLKTQIFFFFSRYLVGMRFWCSLNIVLCICVKKVPLSSHPSIEHFPRSIVEHSSGLQQTWDGPQYFCYWTAVASFIVSFHEHHSCSVFFKYWTHEHGVLQNGSFALTLGFFLTSFKIATGFSSL